jgi:hypothetical protein
VPYIGFRPSQQLEIRKMHYEKENLMATATAAPVMSKLVGRQEVEAHTHAVQRTNMESRQMPTSPGTNCS